MKTIDVSVWVRNLSVVVAVVALIIAGVVSYEAHELAATNAQLVDLIDTQLTTTQARMSALEDLQRESVQLLIDAGPAAYVELLQRETDK